jgi:hypothetical protein
MIAPINYQSSKLRIRDEFVNEQWPIYASSNVYRIRTQPHVVAPSDRVVALIDLAAAPTNFP